MFKNEAKSPLQGGPEVSPAEALLRTCSCLEFGGASGHGDIICSTIPSASLMSSISRVRPTPQPYFYYYQAVIRITNGGILVYKGDQTTFAASALSHYGLHAPKNQAEIPWDAIEDVREEHLGINHTSTRIVFTFTPEAHVRFNGIARVLSGFVLDIQRQMVGDGILEAVKLMSVESPHERIAACRELLQLAPGVSPSRQSPPSSSTEKGHTPSTQPPYKHSQLSQRQQHTMELELYELRRREAAMRADIQHVPREDIRRETRSRSSSQPIRHQAADPPSNRFERLVPTHTENGSQQQSQLSNVPRAATPSPSINYPSQHYDPQVNSKIAPQDLVEQVRRQVKDDSIEREVIMRSTRGSAPVRSPQLMTSIESHEIATDVSDLLRILEREERDGHRSVSAQRNRLNMNPKIENTSVSVASHTNLNNQLQEVAAKGDAQKQELIKAEVPRSTATVPSKNTKDSEPASITSSTKEQDIPPVKLVPGEGWKPILDKSGKTYYVNKALGKSTWKLSETDPIPEVAALSNTVTDAINQHQSVAPTSPTIENDTATTVATSRNEVETIAAAPTSKAPPPPPSKAPPPPPPAKVLPPKASVVAETKPTSHKVPESLKNQPPVEPESQEPSKVQLPTKIPPPPPSTNVPVPTTEAAVAETSSPSPKIPPPPPSKVPPPPPPAKVPPPKAPVTEAEQPPAGKVPPPPPAKVPPPPPSRKTPPPSIPSEAPLEGTSAGTKIPPPPPGKAAPPPRTPVSPDTASDTLPAQPSSPASPSPSSPTNTTRTGGKIYGEWKELVDPKGRKYYCHIKTKETKWAMPPEVAALKAAEEGQPAATSQIEVGADGLRTCGPWKEKLAPDGRKYYINLETKARTWKASETPFS